VFPVAWTLLYLLMGVALFLVLRRPGGTSGVSSAVTVFAVQLVLNGAWSWLFFGLHRPGLALLGIGVLWVTILTATFMFWRIHAAAGVLLLPYLGWVGFASWLNFGFWRLNPGG
jgi:tryptophan-rich sensory protein